LEGKQLREAAVELVGSAPSLPLALRETPPQSTGAPPERDGGDTEEG
jgi:hypothetical protein